MQEQTQVNRTQVNRQTNQRKMTVRKQQFKNFEILAEDILLQIMSFSFQF